MIENDIKKILLQLSDNNSRQKDKHIVANSAKCNEWLFTTKQWEMNKTKCAMTKNQ